MEVVDKDLQFVIDKISTEDSSAVGVTWHLGVCIYIYIKYSVYMCIHMFRIVVNVWNGIHRMEGKAISF